MNFKTIAASTVLAASVFSLAACNNADVSDHNDHPAVKDSKVQANNPAKETGKTAAQSDADTLANITDVDEQNAAMDICYGGHATYESYTNGFTEVRGADHLVDEAKFNELTTLCGAVQDAGQRAVAEDHADTEEYANNEDSEGTAVGCDGPTSTDPNTGTTYNSCGEAIN